MKTATRHREPKTGSTSIKALALYASIVGRQAGVDVVFGNYPTAATDGKRIYMPNLAALGDERWLPILKGLIDHEVMHVRHTKFDALKGCNCPLAQKLSNLIEDCWGERELAKIYPGALRSIRVSMDELVKLEWYRGPAADASAYPAVSVLVIWLLHDLLGRHYVMPNLMAWAAEWRELAERHFESDLLDEILQLMHGVDTCTDSYRAVEIANAVVELLRQAAEDLQDQAQQAQQDQQAQGQQDTQPQDGSSAPQAQQAPDAPQEKGATPGEGQGADKDSDQDSETRRAQGETASGEEGESEGQGQGANQGQAVDADDTDTDAEAEAGDGDPQGSSADGEQPADASTQQASPGDEGDQPNPSTAGQASAAGDDGNDGSSAVGGQLTPSGSGNATGSSEQATASQPQAGSAGGLGGAAAGSQGDVEDQGEAQGATTGWLRSPEELQALAEAIKAALNATAGQIPDTELADAIVDQLKQAGVMPDGSRVDPQNARHAMLLNPGAASRIGAAPALDLSKEVPAEEASTREMAAGVTRKLGAKLRDMLEARVQTLVSYGRRGLRMGSQRLAAAKSGNLNVFRKTEEGDDLSTAISLVVDMSGSMNYRLSAKAKRREAAAAAAFAVAETLAKFDVAFSWVNFGDITQSIKRFHEPWRKQRHSHLTSDLGGTGMDQPLLMLLPELAERPEERKLFLVVTDGEPNDEDSVCASLALMPMLGVEVAMLFIGDDGRQLERSLRRLGITVARADRPEDLAAGIFSAVENAFI